MGKKAMVALGLIAVLVAGAASVAVAKWTVIQAGNLVLKADGGVSPKVLPRRQYVPAAARVLGQISTRDRGHPPAFREASIDFDRDVRINTRGLAACRGGQLEARTTRAAKRVCGKTVVGSGKGRIQISFPEQAPIPVRAPITVFNGGTRGGKTTLYIHTYITVPVPSAVVTTVRIRQGGKGLRTLTKVPVIAGGSGSVLDFSIKFVRKYTYRGKRRSYIEAKCSDGRFVAKIKKALFRNEAGGPRTTTSLRGTVTRSCTPKG